MQLTIKTGSAVGWQRPAAHPNKKNNNNNLSACRYSDKYQDSPLFESEYTVK